MEIGKANYGSSNQKKNAKIVDGNNIYRILPPLGSMASKGFWNKYVKVEWGYKDSDGGLRPFQDVRKVNYKTKMVEVESEAHLARERMELEFKGVVEAFKAGKVSKEDLEKAKKIKDSFNLDKKYYVNAMNLAGEIVLLKFGQKALDGIKSEIKKLSERNIDPLSVENGRFFNIFREGTGLGTVYSVSIHKDIIIQDGEEVEKAVVSKLDDSVIKRLASEATDLADLDKMYPIVTPEEVYAIVTEGPAAVDRILGKKGARQETKVEAKEEVKVETMQETKVEAKVEVAQVVQKEEVVAKPEVKVETQATTTISSSTQAQSTEDYLASLGL